MKRIILLFLMGIALCANAQIFTHKRVLDKFDDVITDIDQKTLIEKTDSTFIVEEKGKEPVTFVIESFAQYNSMGDKDNIVNLVDNVYGYQECWCVILASEYEEYFKVYLSCIAEADETKRMKDIEKMVDKYCYYITRRVVTTQYTHQYLSEHVWVQKGDKNGRTIYSK